MKWLQGIVILTLVMLIVCGSANAAVITESIWGEIEVAPEPESALMGQRVHLFDVTYDNQGTYYTSYLTATGQVRTTDRISSGITYMDDAEFVLSPFVTDIFTRYGGYDPSFFYYSRAYGNDYFDEFGYYKGGVNLWTRFNTSGLTDGQLRVWKDSATQTYFDFKLLERSDVVSASVPEPSTLLLFCIGLLGFASAGRKRNHI